MQIRSQLHTKKDTDQPTKFKQTKQTMLRCQRFNEIKNRDEIANSQNIFLETRDTNKKHKKRSKNRKLRKDKLLPSF